MLPKNQPTRNFFYFSNRRSCYIWSALGLLGLATTVFVGLLATKTSALKQVAPTVPTEQIIALPPFPLGVDPTTKTISENPAVDAYVERYVASNHTSPSLANSWLERVITRLAAHDWYQNLATPASRLLTIESGERHEEISRHFARTLAWSEAEQAEFVSRLRAETTPIVDGKFYPGRYLVSFEATPADVARSVADRFNAEIQTRYSSEIEAAVPLEQALIIASLIEREAYDFTDMRYISGIIWNRLFIDMKLQLDATLQYAKANKTGPSEDRGWWPVPTPRDKFITSPYNTYQHFGLPPAPIANPSIDAIIATLNPKQTDCLFYFHTDDGRFHCSISYQEHVANLKTQFGSGR